MKCLSYLKNLTKKTKKTKNSLELTSKDIREFKKLGFKPLKEVKQIKRKIVIEGGDGVGKTTISKVLKYIGYKNIFDRDIPSHATIVGPPEVIPTDTLYIFLDLDIETQWKRIQDRGKDLDSYWHQYNSIVLYRQKYFEIAGPFGAHIILNNGTIQECVQKCISIISGNDNSRKVIDIDKLTDDEFNKLPLVVEGESKILRLVNKELGLVVIKLKPTVYSYTSNRCGEVLSTDVLRLRASRLLLDPIRAAGVEHAYWRVNDKWILAKLINNPPPIEVIVKKYHCGTPKHRYCGMDKCKVRGGYEKKDYVIENDKEYPKAFVRFDWRNPNWHPVTKKRLCDEVLCDDMADFFINVKNAKETAMKTWNALYNHFKKMKIEMWDICFFISENGKVVYSEVSQDCGRYRRDDENEMESLDKDVWRSGGSSNLVLMKWQKLNKLLEKHKWTEKNVCDVKVDDEKLLTK